MQGGRRMLLKEKKKFQEVTPAWVIGQLVSEFRFHAGINKPPDPEKQLS